MLDMSMQVLKVVIENEEKSADEILGAISVAFPSKTHNTIKGYINTLSKAGYLSVQYGDNRISYIGVNSSVPLVDIGANNAAVVVVAENLNTCFHIFTPFP